MTAISGISHSNSSMQTWQATMQQRKQDFSQLASALQSGDLTGAQSAFLPFEVSPAKGKTALSTLLAPAALQATAAIQSRMILPRWGKRLNQGISLVHKVPLLNSKRICKRSRAAVIIITITTGEQEPIARVKALPVRPLFPITARSASQHSDNGQTDSGEEDTVQRSWPVSAMKKCQ